MGKIRPEIRTFFVSVVGLSTVAWRLAFNFGAYRTIFYETIFGVWVTVSVILIGLFLMPGRDTTVPWWGKILMILPTLALISTFFNTTVATSVAPNVDSWLDSFLIIVSAIATVVSLPYAIYLVINVIDFEILQLPGFRLKFMLAVIVVTIALAGFFVGRNNHNFLNCGDFKISGNDLPVNCRPGPPYQFGGKE